MSGFQYGTYEDLTKFEDDDTNTNENGLEKEEEEEGFVLSTLLEAADEGNIDEIQDLLHDSPNINLNIHNKHLETALHFASASGHENIVHLLVSHGADVHCADKHLDSPLYWAARQGHLKVIECLKNAGADINAKNKVGQTALHAAVRYFQVDVVRYLCSVGADINAQDLRGETVLHMTAWLGSPKLLCDLLTSSGCQLDLKNKNEEAALHIAAGRGSLDCLQSLISHGADVNVTDKRGSTPLHLACHCHHVSIIKSLLEHNCRVDATDLNGESALHAVCLSGNLQLVQMLCEHGCNVDLINKVGRSPLHISAKLGHTEIVRCLLLSEATIDLPSKNNITAEMMALARGKNETSDLLSKLSHDRQTAAIKQLQPSPYLLSRIKLKVFGESKVGKSQLIDSFKCGFIGSLFKRAGIRSSQSSVSPSSPTRANPFQLVTEKSHKRSRSIDITPVHDYYTQGIDVQTCSISGGVGELSIWEFSGYESYYQFFDIFIGDVNCIHVVCFNPLQSVQCQLQEINFWLNFIKSCIPSSETIGMEGKLLHRAKVILVGVLLNPGRAGLSFEEESDEWKKLQEFPKTINSIYQSDLQIHPVVFAIDPDYPMSSQMKSFRWCIADLKNNICKELPRSSGFLESTVAVLPNWRRILSTYPVVTWSNFIEYLRSTVNVLASEEHVKQLIYKLQLMGEVIFVETTVEHEEDLVVLNVHWLCTEVLGRLLSYEITSKCRPTGCFGSDDFQLLFPDCEAVELLHLLQALSLCTRCDLGDDEDELASKVFDRNTGFDDLTNIDAAQGNYLGLSLSHYNQDGFSTEYELPCLNFVETLSGLWDRNDARLAVNTIYGGSRYVPYCAHCHGSAFKSSVARGRVGSLCSESSQNNSRRTLSTSENFNSMSLSQQSLDSLPRNSLPMGEVSPPGTPSFFSIPTSHRSLNHNNHLAHLFPRLQVMLRRHYLPDKSNSEVDLYQWHWGSKYCRGLLEVLVTYERRNEVFNFFPSSAENSPPAVVKEIGTDGFCNCITGSIELKCRGPSDMASELFDFMESIRQVVVDTIRLSCPSLDYRHEILSSSHLSDHRKVIKSFSQKELIEAFMESGCDATVSYMNNDSECFESLLDLISFGNDTAYNGLVFFPDLPITSLPLCVRRKLAGLLDPSDITGCDWCMLAILLGLSEEIPKFDHTAEGSVLLSSTDQVLQMWSSKEAEKALIGVLLSKLTDLGRLDAVEVLMSRGTLYRRCKVDEVPDEGDLGERFTGDGDDDVDARRYDSMEKFDDENKNYKTSNGDLVVTSSKLANRDSFS